VLVVDNDGDGSMAQEDSTGQHIRAGWHTIRVTFTDSCHDVGHPDSGISVGWDIGGQVLMPQPSDSFFTTEVTKFGYDEAGRRTSLTDPNGNSTSWEYDTLNRVTSETTLYGTRSYEYDGNNNLLQKTDRNGLVTTYEYDSLNRRTAENWTDYSGILRMFTYEYDEAGNLKEVSDPDATYEYEYDNLNRQIGVTQTFASFPDPIHFDYVYDAASRMTSSAATIDETADYLNSYSYDTLGRMTQVTQAEQAGYEVSAKRVDFTFNANSQFDTIARYASTNMDNPVASTEFAYDQANRVTSIAHASTALGSSFGETHGYEYDAANRVTRYTTVQDSIDATFNYDNRGQLTDADTLGGSYTYDAAGNRIEDDSTTYTIDPGNRMVSDGTNVYWYDAEGNLAAVDLSDGTFIWYRWDYRNRLTSVVYADEYENPVKGINYTYDAFNQLISREVWGEAWLQSAPMEMEGDGGEGMQSMMGGRGIHPNGVDPNTYRDIYIHDDGQVVLEFRSSYSFEGLTHRYLWGPAVDQLLTDENVVDLFDAEANETLFALTDRMGSICDQVDSSGTLAMHQAFDAYGRGGGIGSDGMSFGYTGRPLDEYAGLQNNLNRWYIVAIGRWASEDPIEFAAGDGNLYRYVGNGPTNLTDPNGFNGQYTHNGSGAFPHLGVLIDVHGPAGNIIGTVSADYGPIPITPGYAAVVGFVLGPNAQVVNGLNENEVGISDWKALDQILSSVGKDRKWFFNQIKAGRIKRPAMDAAPYNVVINNCRTYAHRIMRNYEHNISPIGSAR
jgi:RHS repeat-associated protein